MEENDEIEQHYDYQRLSKVLDKKWENDDIEAQRQALRKEFDVDEDMPAELFYCKTDDKDVRPRVIYKIEEDDWNTGGKFRYWKAKCPLCSNWMKRFITQKIHDPFFKKSTTLRKDKKLNYKDLIQPNETGYAMLYGHKNNQ